jgi:hypothetical protein
MRVAQKKRKLQARRVKPRGKPAVGRRKVGRKNAMPGFNINVEAELRRVFGALGGKKKKKNWPF